MSEYQEGYLIGYQAAVVILKGWRDSLPDSHQDKPGAVRGVDVLISYGPKEQS